MDEEARLATKLGVASSKVEYSLVPEAGVMGRLEKNGEIGDDSEKDEEIGDDSEK